MAKIEAAANYDAKPELAGCSSKTLDWRPWPYGRGGPAPNFTYEGRDVIPVRGQRARAIRARKRPETGADSGRRRRSRRIGISLALSALKRDMPPCSESRYGGTGNTIRRPGIAVTQRGGADLASRRR